MRLSVALVGCLAMAIVLAPPLPARAADESEGGAKAALPSWFNPKTKEYFTLPPFVVPVIVGNSVARQVTLLVTLETVGDDNKEKIFDGRQRLQDAFLRDIYGVVSIRREDHQTYDPDVIKIRLKRVGDRLLGPGIIDDVLVKTTYDRSVAP